MNDGKVISFCSFKCSNTMTSGAEGTGFDTYNLPYFFLLCFIKRRYDKEEFDTDCS